jgi:hypothetical protein
MKTIMALYWVMSYYIVQEKAAEFQSYMKSDKAKRYFAQFEKETGIKYLNTYMTALGFGKYDCEDWFVAPNWAALDKVEASQADNELTADASKFIDMGRPWRSRVLQRIEDAKLSAP